MIIGTIKQLLTDALLPSNIVITTILLVSISMISIFYSKSHAADVENFIPTNKFIKYFLVSLGLSTICSLIISHNLPEFSEIMTLLLVYPAVLVIASFPVYKVMELAIVGGAVIGILHLCLDYKSPLHIALVIAYTVNILRNFKIDVTFWNITKDISHG